MSQQLLAAIDFGLTSTKVMVRAMGETRRAVLASVHPLRAAQVHAALAACDVRLAAVSRLAVTGSQHALLGEAVDGKPLKHINEAMAVGLGGLALARQSEALIVSAGTGTAMIAARPSGCTHVFGTAVGGGTLAGLAQLGLGTRDPQRIDALAQRGNPAGADLTIVDAIGQRLNYLPEDMTAVNLGRVGRGATPTPEDLAAGFVTLVAQTISLIAISTARAEKLRHIVFAGQLMTLAAMRAACERVSQLYQSPFTFVADGAFVGAIGCLRALEEDSSA